MNNSIVFCKISCRIILSNFLISLALGELPRNTDQDVWKDENAMNLYFNFDHAAEDGGINIATATLRLYRLPHQNSTTSATQGDVGCDGTVPTENEKLLRVSIYWYTRSLKKHRGKS